MPYDLLALQYLYGARSFNASDTIYTFSTVFGYSDGLRTIGNLNLNSPTKLTIWDSGGTDILNFSNLPVDSSGYSFNLNEGGWLTTQNAFNGETYQAESDTSGRSYSTTRFGTRIGYGVQIENAAGTTSNDIFYGNSLNNAFVGNAGNDTFYGGGGNDTAVYLGTPDSELVCVFLYF
jgi:Ca2+-binding RTX toxin-like protein